MGGRVWPGILAPSMLKFFDFSQSKSAVNSLHLSTVSAVLSGPGLWQVGGSRLAGCEQWCTAPCVPAPDSRSRRCGWAACS